MKRSLDFKFFKLWFKIFFEVLKRYKISLFLSFLVILLISFAQYKYKVFANPNSINLGLIGTYQEHDLPYEVTKLISDSLVEADDKGRMILGK